MIDLSTASKEMIEFAAKSSVENCLSYFRQYGVGLSYRPRLVFVDALEETSPTTLASVPKRNVGGASWFSKESCRAYNQAVYNRFFGLSLSEDALDEIVKNQEKEIKELHPKTIKNADIIVYKNIRGCKRPLAHVMVHEVWHLIEHEKCGKSENKLITEGGATYVESRFCRVTPKQLAGPYCPLHLRLLYNDSAEIIREIIEPKTNPLKALLDPATRALINENLYRRVWSAFQDAFLEYEVYNSWLERKIMSEHPAYAAFRQNPTATNLINAIRARGYVKTADEIASQNMTRIVNNCRRLIGV